MLPSGSAVFDIQGEWVREWHAGAPFRPWLETPAARAIQELHRCNLELWNLEDRGRGAIDDAALGQLKRQIDRHKLERVRLVNQLDGLLLEAGNVPLAVRAPDPLWNSETPGTLVDRLSILALKLHYGSEIEDEAVAETLEAMARHAGFLCARFDHLLRGLAQGELRFYPSRHVKIFNRLQEC